MTNGRSTREQKGRETIYPRRDDRWDPLPRDACNPPTPRGAWLFSVPFPSPLPSTHPPPYTHPLIVLPSFSRTYPLSISLSQLCSTLMHLLAYRYNCRAIIKAGLSFPPPSSPPIQPPFSPLPSSLPSLFIPPFSLILYLSFLLGPHWIANAFRSRSTCVPIAFCSRSPTPCTDFGGKSRRINFCARISTGACSWRAEHDRGWTVEVYYLRTRRNTRCYSDIKGFFEWNPFEG